VFKQVRPEVIAQQRKEPKENKRATLLQTERDEMESIHGKGLRHGALSLIKFMEFQTSTTSLTNVSFSAESVLLGEMVSLIAENDRFSVRPDHDSLFAVDPSSSTSIPTPPRPVISISSSISSSDEEMQPVKPVTVDRLLGIDLSSDSSSDDLNGFIVDSSDISPPCERLKRVARGSSSDSEGGATGVVLSLKETIPCEAAEALSDPGMDETDSFVSDSSENEICPPSSSSSDVIVVSDDSDEARQAEGLNAKQEPARSTVQTTRAAREKTSSVFDFSYSDTE
jgi:hypothetical protein